MALETTLSILPPLSFISTAANLLCSYLSLFQLILFSFSITASFYGSSHVSLPMQDARATTDISFRFRTARPESLLMLVAGKIDYCLVMMQNGIVKVRKGNFLWIELNKKGRFSLLSCGRPKHFSVKENGWKLLFARMWIYSSERILFCTRSSVLKKRKKCIFHAGLASTVVQTSSQTELVSSHFIHTHRGLLAFLKNFSP